MHRFRGDNMISNEVLLLKIIKCNGSISLLKNRGLSNSQVALLIQDQQDKGNVAITESNIFLTEKGNEYLQKHISKAFPKKKDQWILPKDYLYHTPISTYEIVLPKGKKI